MIQWFRGTLEGLYVGRTDRRASTGGIHARHAHRIDIYRAVIRDIQLIDAPASNEQPRQIPDDVFYQAKLRDARLLAATAPRTWFEGPIEHLEIGDYRLSHPTSKDGKVYGRIVGEVMASFDVPDEPTPEATGMLEALTPPELADPLVNGSVATPEAARGDDPDSADVPDNKASPASIRRLPRAPMVWLTGLIAVALLVTCGGKQAALWCMFVYPTLLVRYIVRGAIGPWELFRPLGALVMVAQWGWTAWLLFHWSHSGCKEILLTPVIGLIAGLFATVVFPSNAPTLSNSSALAIVLFSWCLPIGTRCREPDKAVVEIAPPTVRDPGVPRTNPDGSWPRQP